MRKTVLASNRSPWHGLTRVTSLCLVAETRCNLTGAKLYSSLEVVLSLADRAAGSDVMQQLHEVALYFLHHMVVALLYLQCRFLGFQLLHVLQTECFPATCGHLVTEITVYTKANTLMSDFLSLKYFPPKFFTISSIVHCGLSQERVRYLLSGVLKPKSDKCLKTRKRAPHCFTRPLWNTAVSRMRWWEVRFHSLPSA